MTLEHSAALLNHAPKPGKKYFTLDEANRALVYIRPIAAAMSECYANVMNMRRTIEHCQPHDKEMLEADLERNMQHLGDLVDELNYVGVEIKDFEKALIDFPAVFQCREIYYCWHLGEAAIAAWHEIDTGFAGRQDIALLAEAA